VTYDSVSNGERVTVPGHLLSPRGGDHYVLRVVGDSMIDEMITDGDFVICLRREAAEPGEMVIAQVGNEMTLKRYYLEPGGIVRLEPANRALQPVRLPASEVRVTGIVVGLMRKF
jgi:repressor LexA